MIDRELTAEEIRVLSAMMYDQTIAQINKLTTIKENTMKNWTPKEGELVLVRDRNIDGWLSRKYVTYTNLGIRPYIVLNAEEESAVSYKQMRRIEKAYDLKLNTKEVSFVLKSMDYYLLYEQNDEHVFINEKPIYKSIIDKINAAE